MIPSQQPIRADILPPLSEQPLVSIVTPSYNQAAFIEETIRSVLDQDYPRVEYIVMDGGSTDGTVAILERFRDRLTFISERDEGQTDAINKGFRMAAGEVVAWLNSDDTYLPGAVTGAVDALRRHPEAALVYGQAYHTRQDGSILERYPTEPFSRQRLSETCFICQPAVFMRRAALERAGFLDPSLDFCMDYELWLRLARSFPVVHAPGYWATSRLYAENKTLGQRRAVHWEIARMCRAHFGEVPSSWIFALSHAIVETRLGLDRGRAWQNSLFVLSLTILSACLCLFWNGRIRRNEAEIMRDWLSWFRKGLIRKLLARKT